jgi:hypothetical protein
MPIGYLLRGSSDLAAIYDQLLILKKTQGGGKNTRNLLIDSRHSHPPDPIKIELHITDTEFGWQKAVSPKLAVERWFRLKGTGNHFTANEVVDSVNHRRSKVLEALKALTTQGVIEQAGKRYGLPEVPAPATHLGGSQPTPS